MCLLLTHCFSLQKHSCNHNYNDHVRHRRSIPLLPSQHRICDTSRKLLLLRCRLLRLSSGRELQVRRLDDKWSVYRTLSLEKDTRYFVHAITSRTKWKTGHDRTKPIIVPPLSPPTTTSPAGTRRSSYVSDKFSHVKPCQAKYTYIPIYV